jgi:hypothetical protein
MRNFCIGKVVDKLPAGAAVMVGMEELEGVFCKVDVASVVAAGGWQAASRIIAIIAAEKVKVFFSMVSSISKLHQKKVKTQVFSAK